MKEKKRKTREKLTSEAVGLPVVAVDFWNHSKSCWSILELVNSRPLAFTWTTALFGRDFPDSPADDSIPFFSDVSSENPSVRYYRHYGTYREIADSLPVMSCSPANHS